jgi:hypothetical protein
VRFDFDQSQGDIDVFLLDSNRLLLDSSATTNSPERLDVNGHAGRPTSSRSSATPAPRRPITTWHRRPRHGPPRDADDQLTEAARCL